MDKLFKLRPREMEKFTKDLSIVREEYHSGNFEGNECSKILKNCEKLREILPEDYSTFADCLEKLAKVIFIEKLIQCVTEYYFKSTKEVTRF